MTVPLVGMWALPSIILIIKVQSFAQRPQPVHFFLLIIGGETVLLTGSGLIFVIKSKNLSIVSGMLAPFVSMLCESDNGLFIL